ncbi:Rieske 2Fe-2S domain-containing protein [Actinopolyspora sp. H202]|uniref:Rieske 2Fe-2S domain-containing protein n=1 Tax=Actinopolyspora sp. H202 TaxID=1500456 RepID=UPI003EE745EB
MRSLSAKDRIAEWTWLDKPAGMLRDAVSRTLRGRRLKDALHGVWLGHPLHPAVVQAPMGAFACAGVVDALPGRGVGERRVTRLLIKLGLLASVPAAVAGAADFAQGHEEQQRTGLVHALTSTAALTSYLLSLRWRASGREVAGIAAGWSGLGFTVASGMLGGHLSFHQATSVNHADAVPHIAPDEWTDLGEVADLPEGSPTRRMAGEVPVFVLRDRGELYVLADRCSHASGPLNQGSLSWPDGSPCVECPWHGSVFRVASGEVVHGPATAPQPTFHTRVVDGRLQALVRRIPGVPAGG